MCQSSSVLLSVGWYEIIIWMNASVTRVKHLKHTHTEHARVADSSFITVHLQARFVHPQCFDLVIILVIKWQKTGWRQQPKRAKPIFLRIPILGHRLKPISMEIQWQSGRPGRARRHAGATRSSAALSLFRSERRGRPEAQDLTPERRSTAAGMMAKHARALRSQSKHSNCAIWSRQASRPRQKEASALALHHSLHQAGLALTVLLSSFLRFSDSLLQILASSERMCVLLHFLKLACVCVCVNTKLEMEVIWLIFKQLFAAVRHRSSRACSPPWNSFSVVESRFGMFNCFAIASVHRFICKCSSSQA